jgi:hypothetical protein
MSEPGGEVEVERKLRHFSGRAIGGDKLDKRFDGGAFPWSVDSNTIILAAHSQGRIEDRNQIHA